MSRKRGSTAAGISDIQGDSGLRAREVRNESSFNFDVCIDAPEGGDYCAECPYGGRVQITRPPQSWCFVEDMK